MRNMTQNGQKSLYIYYEGYNNGEIVLLLTIHPQMTGGYNIFNSGKTMNFIRGNGNVLNKYNEIWGIVRSKLGKKFAKEPTGTKKYGYIYTKRGEHGDLMITNFHRSKVSKAPNANSPYKCLPFIRLESITITEENLYYPNTTLEECKYDEKIFKKLDVLLKILKKVHPMNQIMNLILVLIMELMMIKSILRNLKILSLMNLKNLKNVINLLAMNQKTVF